MEDVFYVGRMELWLGKDVMHVKQETFRESEAKEERKKAVSFIPSAVLGDLGLSTRS